MDEDICKELLQVYSIGRCPRLAHVTCSHMQGSFFNGRPVVGCAIARIFLWTEFHWQNTGRELQPECLGFDIQGGGRSYPERQPVRIASHWRTVR